LSAHGRGGHSLSRAGKDGRRKNDNEEEVIRMGEHTSVEEIVAAAEETDVVEETSAYEVMLLQGSVY